MPVPIESARIEQKKKYFITCSEACVCRDPPRFCNTKEHESGQMLDRCKPTCDSSYARQPGRLWRSGRRRPVQCRQLRRFSHCPPIALWLPHASPAVETRSPSNTETIALMTQCGHRDRQPHAPKGRRHQLTLPAGSEGGQMERSPGHTGEPPDAHHLPPPPPPPPPLPRSPFITVPSKREPSILRGPSTRKSLGPCQRIDRSRSRAAKAAPSLRRPCRERPRRPSGIQGR